MHGTNGFLQASEDAIGSPGEESGALTDDGTVDRSVIVVN